MRIYISGPMTGIEEFEKAFEKAEQELRLQGHDAVNPVRLSGIIRSDMKYEEWLKLDMALLDVCDAIYMLSGWQNSRGANREYGFALGSGKLILYEADKWTN